MAPSDSSIPTRALRFTVRYDGTDYCGWQVQPNGLTVQESIESALAQIAGSEIRIHGAGRTDAGVHALGQVFHCAWPVDAEWKRLPKALSGMTGAGIEIADVAEAPDDFHARFSAVGKHYTYSIALGSTANPFLDRYAWTIHYDLDFELLRNCCKRIEGAHDFAGFQCSGAADGPTTKTIYSVALEEGALIGPVVGGENAYRLSFHGDGFLYKMVRNLVGTMIDIARGHIPEDEVSNRLESPGPYEGYTAPAKGLCLVRVDY